MDIYGDSFGQLTSNELGAANLRQRSLESALQNALSSINQLKQRQMLSDQFTQKLAQEKEEYRKHAEFLDQSRKDKLNIYNDEAPMRQSQLLYQQALTDKMEREPSPAQERENTTRLRYVEHLANTGRPVTGMGLPPNDEKLFSGTSDAVNAQTQEAYTRAHALALALSHRDDLDDEIEWRKQHAKNVRRGVFENLFSSGENPGDVEDRKVKLLENEQKQLQRQLKPYVEDKNAMQLVRPNVVSGRWEPAIGPGRQINMTPAAPSASTATPGPAAEQQTDVAPMPRGGQVVSPGRAITNEPAATSSPLPAAAAGQSGSKRDWMTARAQELISKGMDMPSAAARALMEFEQTQ